MVVTPGVTAPAIADPYVAPEPDKVVVVTPAATPTTPATPTPAQPESPEPAQEVQGPAPSDLAAQMDHMLRARRSANAMERALDVYESELYGRPLEQPRSEYDAKIDAMMLELQRRAAEKTTKQTLPMNGDDNLDICTDSISPIPTVVMEVRYHDRTESVKMNLAAIVREKIGAVVNAPAEE
jgi:hypothetical protein